jgi:hypothetical protein
MNFDRLKRYFAGPLLLFLIVVVFHWRLVLTEQFTWLDGPDYPNQVMPWFQFQAEEWHHHRFPMWDPTSWFGQPLLGQAQPGAAYPPNWLLFLLPFKGGHISQYALEWYLVLIRYFAALSAYALCRDLKRSQAASILAGCLYALGGYVSANTWPQMVNGAVWSPLVFLFLLRAERGERPWASSLLSGFCLGIGWLAGHHQMNTFVSLAALGLWIWLSVRTGKLDWRMARLGVCSLGIAVMASGFQTVPTAEYSRLAIRWVGSARDPLRFNDTVPYAVHEQHSLLPRNLLDVFIPHVASPASNPFVGIVGISLAILGVALGWRERQVRWLAVMSLCGILFALGPYGLLDGMLYALVPLVDKARSPEMGTLVFGLGLAPVAAFGLDAVFRPGSAPISRRAGLILVAVAGVLAAAGFVFFIVGTNVNADDRSIVTALCALLLAGLLTGVRTGNLSPRGASAVVVLLVLTELSAVTGQRFLDQTVPSERRFLYPLSQNQDLAGYLRSRPGVFRVEYDQKEISYNLGDWQGLETSNGYLASVTENIMSMNWYAPKVRDFFGVKYFVAKAPDRPGQREVFQASSGLKVFENPLAYPRVWSVHQAVMAPAGTISATMADEKFDPRSAVLLAGGPSPGLAACPASNDDVQLPYHAPNHLRITVTMQCRGMVIVTDTWFPGWRAWVDGKPVSIEQADGGVRGIVVEGGSHVIEMRYLPASILIGALMTILSACIVVFAHRVEPAPTRTLVSDSASSEYSRPA